MKYFVLTVGIVCVFLIIQSLLKKWITARQIKKAGRKGEDYTYQLLKKYVSKKEILLRNVEIEVEGKRAEFDQLLLSNKGIYIFETKYYKGQLKGKAEDDTWLKTKVDAYGIEHTKYVRNPIPQVKREMYLLKKYLKKYHVDCFIEGYVLLVGSSSPINHPMIIDHPSKVKEVLSLNQKRLNNAQMKQIKKILN